MGFLETKGILLNSRKTGQKDDKFYHQLTVKSNKDETLNLNVIAKSEIYPIKNNERIIFNYEYDTPKEYNGETYFYAKAIKREDANPYNSASKSAPQQTSVPQQKVEKTINYIWRCYILSKKYWKFVIDSKFEHEGKVINQTAVGQIINLAKVFEEYIKAKENKEIGYYSLFTAVELLEINNHLSDTEIVKNRNNLFSNADKFYLENIPKQQTSIV